MSPNIVIKHLDYAKVIEFYANVLGFENRSSDSALADFDAHPINLFVIEDHQISGPVHELLVTNLDEARAYLDANGCKVMRWRGKGQDPFGVIYN